MKKTVFGQTYGEEWEKYLRMAYRYYLTCFLRCFPRESSLSCKPDDDAVTLLISG